MADERMQENSDEVAALLTEQIKQMIEVKKQCEVDKDKRLEQSRSLRDKKVHVLELMRTHEIDRVTLEGYTISIQKNSRPTPVNRKNLGDLLKLHLEANAADELTQKILGDLKITEHFCLRVGNSG